MTADEVLSRVIRVGFDAAPIIYYVEGNVDFEPRCTPFFHAIGRGRIEGFTSSISLPETLVHPFRMGDAARETAFRDLLLDTEGMTTRVVSIDIAEVAAWLRATYNLRTPDAVQVATALHSGCDIFLTNDDKLKRVQEIEVVVVSELT